MQKITNPKNKKVPYNVYLLPDHITRAQRMAKKKNVRAGKMMADWIVEQLFKK